MGCYQVSSSLRRQLMMLQSVTPLVDELGRYMVDHGTLVEVLLSLSQYT